MASVFLALFAVFGGSSRPLSRMNQEIRKSGGNVNCGRDSSADCADLRRFSGEGDIGFSESVKICVNLWIKFPVAMILAAALEAASVDGVDESWDG
jgi:hypothetical protein